jgi:hypothetical protein
MIVAMAGIDRLAVSLGFALRHGLLMILNVVLTQRFMVIGQRTRFGHGFMVRGEGCRRWQGSPLVFKGIIGQGRTVAGHGIVGQLLSVGLSGCGLDGSLMIRTRGTRVDRLAIGRLIWQGDNRDDVLWLDFARLHPGLGAAGIERTRLDLDQVRGVAADDGADWLFAHGVNAWGSNHKTSKTW